jgi:hypothetical protein
MPMKSPSLTVIVPTRNRPSAISALQSVVAEAAMLDHLHVVVIDDHSDDGSHRAVAAWAAVQGARATFRRNARQRGPGASRNIGLDLATGDYTLFLDSDDRLEPGAIAAMLMTASDEAADILFARCDWDMAGVPAELARRRNLQATEVIDGELGEALSVAGKLFRTEFLRATGLRFSEERMWGESKPLVASALIRARRVSVLADRRCVRLGTDAQSLELSQDSVLARLSTALETLDAIDAAGAGRPMTTNIRTEVFRSNVVSAVAILLARGEVTVDEATLLQAAIARHLDEAMLDTLAPADVALIERLFAPFVPATEGSAPEARQMA